MTQKTLNCEDDAELMATADQTHSPLILKEIVCEKSEWSTVVTGRDVIELPIRVKDRKHQGIENGTMVLSTRAKYSIGCSRKICSACDFLPAYLNCSNCVEPTLIKAQRFGQCAKIKCPKGSIMNTEMGNINAHHMGSIVCQK
ncbi:hypothetical protein PFISCL1PPCAC_4180, partial [Pristionchus fissidentatus]